MKKISSKMIPVLFATLMTIQNLPAQAGSTENSDMREPTTAHMHLQRLQFRAKLAARKPPPSPLLKFNGGTVLRTNKSQAIFWGADWANPVFAGDKITGIDAFFSGFPGSSYSRTANEYSDKSGYITAQSTYLGHVIDTSAVPKRELTTAQAVTEVCKVTDNHPESNGVYFIYTATPSGSPYYCAWHSWGKCRNGAAVQVAYMPRLDGIAGCDPGDKITGNSEGLAALANVTAHEFLESITDPRGTGWFDSSGQENGDKCAWSFPAGNGISVFANGSQWLLQMEWSNAAFLAGTGLPNRSGQKACIY